MKQHIQLSLAPDSHIINQMQLIAGTYSIRVSVATTLDADIQVLVKDDLSGLSVGREIYIPNDNQEHHVITLGALFKVWPRSQSGYLSGDVFISRIS